MIIFLKVKAVAEAIGSPCTACRMAFGLSQIEKYLQKEFSSRWKNPLYPENQDHSALASSTLVPLRVIRLTTNPIPMIAAPLM